MKLRDKLEENGELNRYLLGGLVYFRIVDPKKELADCAGMPERFGIPMSLDERKKYATESGKFAFKKVEIDDDFDSDERILGMSEASWGRISETNLNNESVIKAYEDNKTERE